MTRTPPFRIVDCTLREGEQFAQAAFDTDQRLRIARELDAFGADVIELTSPAASPRALRDAKRIAELGLAAEVAVHVRCHPDDARAALESGADAIHVVLGTSPALRHHSHGRDVDEILAAARDVLPGLREAGRVVRFSCEDAFRTPLRELLRIVQAVEALGVDRIGLADTVGAATPRQVDERVGIVRQAIDCDLEFHGHNDGGCAIANLWAAYRAGATHLDVTVLGIGERNGICSLGGLVARALQSQPELVDGYDLTRLPVLDALVADAVGIEIPFNACLTSPTAFAHKAGLHTNAVLRAPETYESIDPAVVGRSRDVLVAHALVGRHAIAARARSLGLCLEGASLRAATLAVKALADAGPPSDPQIERVLREHADLHPNLENPV